MAIPTDLTGRQYNALKESSTTSGQTGLVVVNPDGSSISGTGLSFSNITTATTTTVKSGSGLLHTLSINSTAAGTITIYDNTAASGTKIATIKASVVEQTYIYDIAFTTGLTIVTGAASDITVSYR